MAELHKNCKYEMFCEYARLKASKVDVTLILIWYRVTGTNYCQFQVTFENNTNVSKFTNLVLRDGTLEAK